MSVSSVQSAHPGDSFFSYLPALVGAVAVHALIYWLISGGFDVIRLHEPVKPAVKKVVQASLVVVEKKKPVKSVAKRPVKKPKPAPKIQPKPKVKSKPEVTPKVEPKPAPKPIEPDNSARQQELLDELFAEEDQQLEQDQELSEVARYSAVMTQLIEQYWSRPPSARNGMQVVLVIELVPSGDVTSVNIKQSSGNTTFDRAAVLAVEKIARFDTLRTMEPSLFNRYFRKIELTFRPEDLRL